MPELLYSADLADAVLALFPIAGRVVHTVRGTFADIKWNLGKDGFSSKRKLHPGDRIIIVQMLFPGFADSGQSDIAAHQYQFPVVVLEMAGKQGVKPEVQRVELAKFLLRKLSPWMKSLDANKSVLVLTGASLHDAAIVGGSYGEEIADYLPQGWLAASLMLTFNVMPNR